MPEVTERPIADDLGNTFNRCVLSSCIYPEFWLTQEVSLIQMPLEQRIQREASRFTERTITEASIIDLAVPEVPETLFQVFSSCSVRSSAAFWHSEYLTFVAVASDLLQLSASC